MLATAFKKSSMGFFPPFLLFIAINIQEGRRFWKLSLFRFLGNHIAKINFIFISMCSRNIFYTNGAKS
ncbi:MAG: hypothetical protein K0R69_3243 [Clostridia bacterium]|jgi:hypothetical protein|nr:hypothetical protein [Clostridia bacterium]